MKIHVYPHTNSIDHIYRFYERDSKQVKLTFPALYSYTLPSPDKKPILFCNNSLIAVEWANDYEIRLTLKVPAIMQKVYFYVLAYNDSYFRE